MKSRHSIYVTKPTMPPIDDFISKIRVLWETRELTNGGTYHQQLEEALCKYLAVPYISLFTNATTALITAIKALELTGEVITTPYSFVATCHAIAWNNLTPVFADIDIDDFNLSISKIEEAITGRTTAILPVHCYGLPCKVEQIHEIANAHKLQVIYDAAHAFGVDCDCGSILNHGDLSVLSFHATKTFHTFEGGAIVSYDRAMKKKIDKLKNFGFCDEVTVTQVGINGKMSEINAAFGLLQLEMVEENIEKRLKIANLYYDYLTNAAQCIRLPFANAQSKLNYGYYPILINDKSKATRDEVYNALRKSRIFTRRYFYPLISNMPMYKELASASPDNLPVSNYVADRVLCLPIFPELTPQKVKQICSKLINLVS